MQAKIRCEFREEIAWIHMDDGKVNAINQGWLAGMNKALDRVLEEGSKAIVWRGRQKVFCAGLDLKTLPQLPRAAFVEVLRGYRELCDRLMVFERPIVAAVTGHALAGGAINMLCCDYALATEGSYQIGLNETAIGLPLPTFVIELARTVLSPPHQMQAIVHGKIYDPEGAHAVGFVDELCSIERWEGRAQELAQHLGALPHHAYITAKRRYRAHAIEVDPELFIQEASRFLPESEEP